MRLVLPCIFRGPCSFHKSSSPITSEGGLNKFFFEKNLQNEKTYSLKVIAFCSQRLLCHSNAACELGVSQKPVVERW